MRVGARTTRSLSIALIGAMAFLWSPGAFAAGGQVDVTSVTSIQVRQSLDRARHVPLVQDLSAAFAVHVPGPNLLTGAALLKLGTVFGTQGGDVDLYLLSVSWRRPRRSFRLVGGRQLLTTPTGLRIVDGASLHVQPTRALTVRAAAGWLRDTERNDLIGGALLLQGGASVSAFPGTYATVQMSFRAGPDLAPRLDGRISADAVIAAPLAPHPWIDASFRVDSVGLRRVRGGVVLTPSPIFDVEVKGRVARAADEDGTMSERILADLTSGPVATVAASTTVRTPLRLSGRFGYGVSHYDVNPGFSAWGHGVDARVRWSHDRAGLEASYMLRSSYGGFFHGIGIRATVRPHEVLRIGVAGQVAPYRKLAHPWQLAQWWLAEAAVLPPTPIPMEFKVGGEYRAGATMAHDFRLNASFVVRVAAGRTR